MALAQVSNQLLRSDGNSATTVAASWPITGNGSQELPLGLDPSYSGADGISPIFDISAIPSGHRVTISGAQGSSSFDVMNGAQGDQGVQGETGPQGPEGPQGPSGQQGPAGQNGVNGISPTFRFDRSGDYVVVTMSGAQGEDSFTIYDGTSATEYSAGANIDITDHVISGKDWTEEITSATSGKLDTSVFESYTATHSGDDTAAYSAGDNIDITDHVISGKDWSDDINNASTAGSAAATAWVSDQHYLTEHQSLSALMSADLLGVTGGVITGYSGMPVSAGMTYSGIAPIVVNNEEEKISADCVELSAGSGIDSNKLALGIIEVSSQGGGTSNFSASVTGDTRGPVHGRIGTLTNTVYTRSDDGSYHLTGVLDRSIFNDADMGYTMPSAWSALSGTVGGSNFASSAFGINPSLQVTALTSLSYYDTGIGKSNQLSGNNTNNLGWTMPSAYTDVKSNIIADADAQVQSHYSYKLSYTTPATGFTGNSGLEIRKYVGNTGTTRKVLSGNSTVGELVPEDYTSRQYLSTNAAGNMVWDDISNISPIVLVATSGDIPPSGTTDGKLYVVTGT